MTDLPNRKGAAPPGETVRRADQQCDRFEAAWKAGQKPRLEDFLAALPEAQRGALLRDLILVEIDYRRLAGEQPGAEEFLARFPALDLVWIADALAAGQPNAKPVERLGKFQLLDQLGKGGCGTVWKARDTELDRIVAVKIPDSDFLLTEEVRARFTREARAAARLSHPNVVLLLEVDQVGETSLLVMEFVEGTDLQHLVKQNGPLPMRQACEFVRQAANGLQHAHERGLVHRDVKPANLLVTAPRQPPGNVDGGSAEGRVVKVADLGLARMLLGGDSASAALTASGTIMGTADFIAPEQARDTRNADARADIYSLGCTLYFLLTGEVPFPGGTFTEKMLRHLTEQPTPVELLQPAVPAALANLVRSMMARRPEDRPQSAAAVAASLAAQLRLFPAAPGAELTSHGPHEALPSTEQIKRGAVSLHNTPGPQRRGRHLAVALVGGVAVLAVLLTLVQPWDGLKRQEESPETPAPAPRSVEPETFLTNSIGMELALIRPGRFTMGSPLFQPDRDLDEPPHEVELTEAYYIGVCEVTQGQFQEVMNYNPSFFSPKGQGHAVVKGQNTGLYPVECVRWEEAKAFCDALSALPRERQAGHKYRLPTEAEWEYACRAGSQTIYSFGRDAGELGLYAWFQDNALGRTHAVKQKQPNPWKLYDMHGNVWEWCEDFYDPDYYGISPQNDPLCKTPTGRRVLRGGAWGEFASAFACRSAKRGRSEPAAARPYYGLRVVFTAAS